MEYKAKPKVTVLMPVYNGEKYLAEAIESILNQTYQDYEFLIINDGSTDRSEAIINTYRDKRIRLVNNNENIKLIATLNKGIELSRGKYIARMDCDDISHPTRLSEQVEYMEKNQDVVMCGTWVETIGLGRKQIWKYPTEHNQIQASLLFECVLAHPTVIIKKAILNELEIYYDKNYIHAEDYELWKRLSKYKISNIPKVLLKYRILTNSVSNSNRKTQQQSLINIHKKTLKELNLYSSINHRTLSYLGGGELIEILQIERELSKLIKINQERLYYKSECLEQAIINRWIYVCNSSTELGLRVFSVFINSHLIKRKRINYIKVFKLLIKCLVKKKNL
ncbi:glycosyltransferase [Priestia megaterium]|uniref:glycosyltransferase family 2 protein n=1 Tax=Priestia megaterium TaxID=1404 RepID=UPI00234F98C1|nr:glycosyltransferase [Priestia megaterium]MDC7771444.1 glycosyltransferase [Priestia megaterium]